MQMFLATLFATAAVAAPSTQPATNVSAGGATLNGTVDTAGMAYFEYGTTTGYGLNTAPQAVTPGPVSANISGLTAETTYHFRIRMGADAGQDLTFPTAANPKPPSVSDQRARSIAAESATATASVNPNGSPTTYRIEYGTSTRYGRQTTPAQIPGGSAASISVQLADLRPYTRYHWRTVATNAAGTTRGADRSFRTGRLPTGVSLARSRKTVPWGGDVRLGGRVSGAGVAGMTVELQQQRAQDSSFVQADTARTGNDGGYLFTIPKLWETTRYRVVTRTQAVATSAAVTVRSRVRAGIRSRLISRKRARLSGTIIPGITGTVELQLYRRGSGWDGVRTATLTPATESTSAYRFIVRRLKRTARRFRVIARPEPGGYARGWSRSVVVKTQPRKKKRRG
jgi:hypothetical protein